MPLALPVPAVSWPVWSPALRALVRIHRCRTLCQTLQRHTALTLPTSGRSRGHSLCCWFPVQPPVSPVKWWLEHSLHSGCHQELSLHHKCHQQGGTSGSSASPYGGSQVPERHRCPEALERILRQLQPVEVGGTPRVLRWPQPSVTPLKPTADTQHQDPTHRALRAAAHPRLHHRDDVG